MSSLHILFCRCQAKFPDEIVLRSQEEKRVTEDAPWEVGRSLCPWLPAGPCPATPHMLKNLGSWCLSFTVSLALYFCDFIRTCQAGKYPLEIVDSCTQMEIIRPTAVLCGLAVQLKAAFHVILEDLSSCQLSLIYCSSLRLLAICLHLRSFPVLCCGICSLDIGRFLKELSPPVSSSSLKGLSANLCLTEYSC